MNVIRDPIIYIFRSAIFLLHALPNIIDICGVKEISGGAKGSYSLSVFALEYKIYNWREAIIKGFLNRCEIEYFILRPN